MKISNDSSIVVITTVNEMEDSIFVIDLDQYFLDDKLLDNNLSWENSKVKFFSIFNLPNIRTKQIRLIDDITDFLQNKHQLHQQFQ